MSQIQLNDPVLQLTNLSVRFIREFGILRRRISIVDAVSDVSLSVNRSETISIVGESGSGKSTLAKCILRLVDPTSGAILYNGNDVKSLNGKDLLRYRRDVQMIFQDPYESLNPRQNVFSAIAMPYVMLTGEKDRAKVRTSVVSLMNEVNLNPDKFMHRLPHQLSGGERQRVNIARALASDPKILVADEPITMLDAAQRLSVLGLIQELKMKRNLTIIFITHDLASAKQLGGRAAVMYSGKLVESGDTEAVLSNPLHPYVELIRESSPTIEHSILEGEVDERAGSQEVLRVNRGCVFEPRCKYGGEICKTTEPILNQLSPMHYAACHYPLDVKKVATMK